jgi:hypothetical protein
MRTTWSFGHIAIPVGAATILTGPALLNFIINIVLQEYSAAGSNIVLQARYLVPGSFYLVKGRRMQAVCYRLRSALQAHPAPTA